MDTADLTVSDKLAIVDVTARIAVCMFLAMVVFCGLLLRVSG